MATEHTRSSVPWWYRFVYSWRVRMWIETGIWVPVASPDTPTPATNLGATPMIEVVAAAAFEVLCGSAHPLPPPGAGGGERREPSVRRCAPHTPGGFDVAASGWCE